MKSFFKILVTNGWHCDIGDKDDYRCYNMQILASYWCECFALVAEHSGQLSLNGHYGVAWIEVTIENHSPYDFCDLESMIKAIELAENNLLLIGIPFAPDYKFHGKNKANKTRRNNKLRKEWNLDQLENEECELE